MTKNYSSQTIRVSEKLNTTYPKAIILLHTFKILKFAGRICPIKIDTLKHQRPLRTALSSKSQSTEKIFVL
jgi:hypothetical protein